MLEPSNLVSDKTPVQSLLTTTAVVIIGFAVVGPMLGLIVASGFYEGDLLNDFLTFEEKPEMFYAIMVMQGIVTLVGLIVFPYIQIRLLEQKSLQAFFPSLNRPFFVLLLVGLLAFNFMIAISPIVEWNATVKFPEFLGGFEEWARSKEDELTKFTEAVTQFGSVQDMLLGLLVVALLPAIGEELVFRGMIQNEMWRGTRNVHLSIWISAFVFSAIHVQFYGFVPRLLLGALFGYLYYWSGNLLVPVFAHFFNNGFSVVAIYLSQIKIVETDIKEIESAPLPAVAFGAALTTALLYYLWKFFNMPAQNPADRNVL